MLRKTLFYQRPLKSQRELIGACELERDQQRLAWGRPLAQRFRLVQQVNNTRVITPHGEWRELTPDERVILIDELDREGDLRFTKAKKLLGLSRNHVFGFEEGGEKRFLGNRTNAALVKALGALWWKMSQSQRQQVIEDLLSFEKKEPLKRRAMKAYGLSEKAANALADTELEPDYCRLSRVAIERVLPLMEEGVPYMTAVKEVYGERRTEPVDELPPVLQGMEQMRNPVVVRALTELRKVVNAIVRRYGKPDVIRIELARDMRRSKKQRQAATKRNRDNEKRRENAAERLRTEVRIQHPTRDDIERVLLHDECGGVCPYTGRAIPIAALFGMNPQFDVEHIIPWSRSLDNSFLNKTLCYHQENRSRKTNRTPWEAYGHDESRWNDIIQRVKRFHGEAAREKLQRFQMKDTKDITELASQQLNDTRYASRAAAEYVGLLYGGLWDENRKRRVFACRGTTTAFFRLAWGVNGILGDGDLKTRDDHRHHAVDAAIVAMTTPGLIKALSDRVRKYTGGRLEWRGVAPPWDSFEDELRQAIGDTVVSHRVSRRVSGPLHEDTVYSFPKADGDGGTCLHRRRPLDSLDKRDIDNIVDDAVRERVRVKLAELGGNIKRFQDPDNHPYLESGDGRRIPIHKVRLRSNVSVHTVGHGDGTRNVRTRNNHHVEVYEEKGGKGPPVWRHRLVPLLEAAERRKNGQEIVQRGFGPDTRFIFSLASGELVELDDEEKGRAIWVVRTVSETKGRLSFEMTRDTDARTQAELRKAKKARFTAALSRLQKLNAQKVAVNPAGEVQRAHD